jgi:heme/copper-type cytochrome/quinol oxidase subunit 1
MAVSAAILNSTFNVRLCRNAAGCVRGAFVVLDQAAHCRKGLRKIMRGAPFGLRPAGWFVGLTLLAARLVETSGMGFLRLSFRLATALLPLSRRLFAWNRISPYSTYLSAAGALLFLALMYDAFAKNPLAGDNPLDAGALVRTSSSPPPFRQFETPASIQSLER